MYFGCIFCLYAFGFSFIFLTLVSLPPPSFSHSQTHTLPVCRVAKASKNTLCLNQGYKLLSSKNRQVKIVRIWGIKHVVSCALERIFFFFLYMRI